MSQHLRNFVRKMYVYKFFDDLVFIYPFYVLMMQDGGLTPLQVSAALLIWSATSFLLEIPSGVIADKYPRKYVLILAQLVRILGYAIWLLFPSFLGFVSGFVLWGVKSAFTSGTYDALVYDELKEMRAEKEYTKYIGKINGIAYLGLLVSALGASVAIHWGYSFVLVISLLSLTVSALAISTVPRAKAVETTHEKEYLKLLKEGLTFALRSPLLLGLIIFISLVQGLGGALDEYWSVFASASGVQQNMVAVFIAVYGGVQFVASNIAYRFAGLSNRILYLMVVIQGTLLLAASLIFKPFAVLFLLIFTFIFKVVDTVYQGRLQDKLPSHIRATTSSVKGFFVEIAVMAVYIGFGALAQSYDYQMTFGIFGAIIAIVGIIYLVKPEKELRLK